MSHDSKAFFGRSSNMVGETLSSNFQAIIYLQTVALWSEIHQAVSASKRCRLFSVRNVWQYSLLLFARRHIFLHGVHIFQPFPPHVCSFPLSVSLYSLVIVQNYSPFDRTENILFYQNTSCAWLCYTQTKM